MAEETSEDVDGNVLLEVIILLALRLRFSLHATSI
jgi:hypothetical protein